MAHKFSHNIVFFRCAYIVCENCGAFVGSVEAGQPCPYPIIYEGGRNVGNTGLYVSAPGQQVMPQPAQVTGGRNVGDTGLHGSAPGQQVLPQQLPRAPEVYLYTTETLRDVDGSLTMLSSHHGFCEFVRANAVEMGITGYIQRYHNNDVRLCYEGIEPQVRRFVDFLNLCASQGMIGAVNDLSRSRSEMRRFNAFRIVANGGTILKGTFSDDDECDKVPADSPIMSAYQSGHNA